MSELTIEQAKEAIYQSMIDDNADIDQHIANLKAAMVKEGAKDVVFQPEKLAQNNRQGRKHMQSYFKKRGVKVVFSA